MDDGQIVHCPQCGAAMVIKVEVNQVTVYETGMLVQFHQQRVHHTCEKGR